MIEKIKELFAMLPRTEQLELLRELNSNVATDNPVAQLNELSQLVYAQNIKFEVTNVGDQHTPDIKVELTTPWGIFETHGINQRIAKTRAAEVAIIALNDLNDSETDKNEESTP